MKKSAIIRIVICAVLLVALVGVFVLGMHWYRTGTTPWNWNSVNFGGVNIGGYTYKNSEKYSVGGGDIDPKGIKNLEIHWIGGEVNVYVAKTDCITLTEDAGLAEEDQLRYLVDGDTLIVQFCAPRAGIYSMEGSKTLDVSLPVMLQDSLRKLTVDSVSAGGRIQSITADSCKIDNVSGGYRITDCSFRKLDINNVSGKCFFAGSVLDLEMDTVSGDLTAEISNKPEEIDANSVSGCVELTVPADFGFRAEVDSVSGDMECDLPMTKSGEKYIVGDGEADIQFDTVSGDLVIRAAQ